MRVRRTVLYIVLAVGSLIVICFFVLILPLVLVRIQAHKNLRPEFAPGASFHDGLAPVIISGMYGYIDKTGRVVIKPKFLIADNFSEGLAWVVVGDFSSTTSREFGILDTSGHVTLTPKIKVFSLIGQVDRFSEGLAKFDQYSWVEGKEDSATFKSGYVNRFGQIVIQPKFVARCPFSGGRASVTLEGEHLVIDPLGATVIGPFAEGSLCFSEGLLPVNTNSGWGYIDRDGKVAIPANPSYDIANEFSEGLASVSLTNDQFTYINEAGESVIPPFACKFAGPFKGGLARVQVESNTWGYIDKTGKWMITPRYTDAEDFSEGLALVEIQDERMFVDRNGKVVLTTSILPSQVATAPPLQTSVAADSNDKGTTDLPDSEAIRSVLGNDKTWRPSLPEYAPFDRLRDARGGEFTIDVATDLSVDIKSDKKRIIVLNSTPPNEDGGGPGCDSLLSAGVFHREGVSWIVDEKYPILTVVNNCSVGPQIGFVQLGPDKLGIRITKVNMHQGVGGEESTFLLLDGKTGSQVFDITTMRQPNPDPDAVKDTTQIVFLDTVTNGLYNLRTVRMGNAETGNASAMQVQECSFNGHIYVCHTQE
jgi:hypothetical protein